MNFKILLLFLLAIGLNRVPAQLLGCNDGDGRCKLVEETTIESGSGTVATSTLTPQGDVFKATNVYRCNNTLHFCAHNKSCDVFFQHVPCRCIYKQAYDRSDWNEDSSFDLCSKEGSASEIDDEGLLWSSYRMDEFFDGSDNSGDFDAASLFEICNECQCDLESDDEAVVGSPADCEGVSTSLGVATTTSAAATSTTPLHRAKGNVPNFINALIPPNTSNDNISNESLTDILTNLTSIIANTSLDDDSATVVLKFFGDLSSSTDAYEPQVTTKLTTFTDVLLNSMILNNGSFQLRSGNLSVAAIDLPVEISESLTFSSSSGLHSSEDVESSFISLPSSLLSPNQRVTFVGYDNAGLFRSPHATSVVGKPVDTTKGNVINSAVIGSTVNHESIKDLKSPVKIGLPILTSQIADKERDNMTVVKTSLYNPKCVFFDYSLNKGLGDWSSKGCITIEPNPEFSNVQCLCYHLTNFAVLMSVETKVTDFVLDMLTYAGCVLSITGLLACIVTYSYFRQLRKNKSQQILLNFCIALCGVYVVYLLNIAASLPSDQAQCTAGGIFLYFFTSATFSWMLVEILHMYIMFVDIWNSVSHMTRKACLFGWGIPLLLTTITLIVHFCLRNTHPDDHEMGMYPLYRDTAVCWMTALGFKWAFLLPIGIIFLVNLILFVVVLYHVTCKRAKTNKSTQKHNTKKKIKVREHIVNAFAILVLSGPTWVIGFFINIDPNPDGAFRRILSYVFVIFNVFQGLWIFVVFILRPQAVRSAWRDLICGRPQYEVTRNISSGGWVGGKRTKSSNVQSPSYQTTRSSDFKSVDDSGKTLLDKSISERKQNQKIELEIKEDKV